MKTITTIILAASFLLITSCNQKKTAEDIYKDEKIRVDLSATPVLGYAPLDVDFSAYLETKTVAIEREIAHVKWVITGPGDFRREIIQESENFQEDDSGKESFFYLNYVFGVPGRYQVKLLLNEGEYSSRPVTITARTMGGPNGKRY